MIADVSENEVRHAVFLLFNGSKQFRQDPFWNINLTHANLAFIVTVKIITCMHALGNRPQLPYMKQLVPCIARQ